MSPAAHDTVSVEDVASAMCTEGAVGGTGIAVKVSANSARNAVKKIKKKKKKAQMKADIPCTCRTYVVDVCTYGDFRTLWMEQV